MSGNNQRLLLEIASAIKEANRQRINPAIKELKVDDLKPVIEMVATARAEYLKEMFNLAEKMNGELPTIDQVKHLRYLRMMFEELTSGSQALETAIERGYLDVN